MPTMQGGPSLCPDKGISLDNEERTSTSLEESSFTLKRSPRHPLEGFLQSISDTKKYSVRRNCKGCLDTPSGIMLSNYFPEPPRHYQGGSSPLLKARSLKRKSSWPNI